MHSGGTLIGRYGYCNQEMVNLSITGRATTNVSRLPSDFRLLMKHALVQKVFDGTKDLGGGLRLDGVHTNVEVRVFTTRPCS